MKILHLQFAFFLKDVVERPDQEFYDLNSVMLNIFDAIPQIMPIPRELPTDVPVMTLNSSNQKYRCSISRSRIDFVLTRVDDTKNNTELLNDFNTKVLGLIKYIFGKQEVIRFGMISRYFYKDTNAIKSIQKKYFNNSVDGVDELSLRFNKKTDASGFLINDVIEISAVEALTNGQKEKGVLIQRDINNDLKIHATINEEKLLEISKKFASKLTENEIKELIL